MNHFNHLINEVALFHKRQLSSFDIQNAHSAVAQLSESVVDNFLPDATKYCGYIDRAMEYTKGTTVSADELYGFYNRLSENTIIDSKNLVISVRNFEDIDKIRPEYLQNFPLEFDKVVTDMLRGTANSSEIKSRYISGKFSDKIRRQLVRTSLPYNNAKDLLSIGNTGDIVVTSEYIRNSIIPFIRTYEAEVKNLSIIGLNLKAMIINTNADMQSSMTAVDSAIQSPDMSFKSKRLLNYFKYNMYRQYLGLCAYVTSLFIRKMTYYTYNMMIYTVAYTTIRKHFTTEELGVIESAIEGNSLSDLREDDIRYSLLNNRFRIVVPYLQHVLGYLHMNISNRSAKLFDCKVKLDSEEFDYDRIPYVTLNKTIMNIGNDIKAFMNNMRDKDSIVDDVMHETHLDESFISQYGDTIQALTNTDYYSSAYVDCDNPLKTDWILYSELKDFERNAGIIAGNIAKCADFVVSIQDAMVSNEFGIDDVTFAEYKSAIDNIQKNFDDYAITIGKKLIERIDVLVAMISEPEETVEDPSPFIGTDYSEGVEAEEFEDICMIEQDILESVHKDYLRARAKRDTGANLVFEAEGDQQTGDNATADKAPDAPSPTVTTDANTQHSSEETQKSGTSAKETVKGWIERFKEFISNILSKFRKKSDTITAKNNAWIAKNKEAILGLNYANTTINVASYENLTVDKITSEISSAKTKIDGINAGSVPNDLKKRETAEKFIFSGIPGTIGAIKAFKPRILQFFTFGNTDKAQLKSYSGDEAKAKVEDMISFCEQYQQTTKSVENNLKAMTDAAANKQQEIINNLGTQSQAVTTTKTESVFTEAPAPVVTDGVKAKGSKEDNEKLQLSSMITSIARDYSSNILTALEKKYLDYMKILSTLAPKPAKNEEKPETSGENPENK